MAEPFYDTLKVAFGGYLRGFYEALVPDTDKVEEFAARGFEKSVVWVAGRMVDDVNAMLNTWRKNKTAAGDRPTPFIPLVMVAIDPNYTAAPPDWAPRQLGDPQSVIVPGDPLERVLALRSVQREHRAQIVFMGPEPATVNSLAMQFHMYVSSMANRRFQAVYVLAGVNSPWPVMIENPDIIAVAVPPDEEKNLTILACDFLLRPTIPIVKGPKTAEPNDGRGAGTFADPHGQPVVIAADVTNTAREDLTVIPSDRTYQVTP